jgi:hypothetical protein
MPCLVQLSRGITLVPYNCVVLNMSNCSKDMLALVIGGSYLITTQSNPLYRYIDYTKIPPRLVKQHTTTPA